MSFAGQLGIADGSGDDVDFHLQLRRLRQCDDDGRLRFGHTSDRNADAGNNSWSGRPRVHSDFGSYSYSYSGPDARSDPDPGTDTCPDTDAHAHADADAEGTLFGRR